MNSTQKWGTVPAWKATRAELERENDRLRCEVRSLYDETYKLRQALADADLRLEKRDSKC